MAALKRGQQIPRVVITNPGQPTGAHNDDSLTVGGHL